jgi:two-component system, sensor histidine kinase PdtaS
MEAASALGQLISQPASPDQSALQTMATRFGRNAYKAGLPFREAVQLLEKSTSVPLSEIKPDILGWIVQGFSDEYGDDGENHEHRAVGKLASQVLRLTALHHINRAATGSLQLDKMLSTVVQVVAEAVGSDACSVFLYDSYSDTLMLRATHGLNPGAVGRVVIRSDAGITGLAATTRETQTAEDARNHPAFFTFPIVGEDTFASQVSVPIVLRDGDRLVGVLNIQTAQPETFATDEIDFLETAAGELAIAIENARLYSQTDAALRQRIHELDVLQSVTRSIASTLKLDDLLPRVAEFAKELVEGDQAVIFEFDEATSTLKLLSSSGGAHGCDLTDIPIDFARTICDTRSAMEAPPSRTGGPPRLLVGAPLMTSRGLQGALCVSAPTTTTQSEDRLSLLQSFADSAAMAMENAELYEEARIGYETTSTLLQEMHHRVRNNLQTVAALLSMQARHAGHAEWTQALQEAVARVQSIATIHDLLSQGSLTSTTVEAIARKVTDEASINVVPPSLTLRFQVMPNKVEIRSRQATIFALLLNEVLTNAIVHGMRDRTEGTIRIEAVTDGAMTEIHVDDDGIGLPDEFDLSAQDGLGLRIISTLATSDLKGGFDLVRLPDGGTRAMIRFPSIRGEAE